MLVLDGANAHSNALRDPRTGVYERRYFEESMLREYDLPSRRGSVISLALVAVDGLDKVKASWGQNSAQALVARVAVAIGKSLRAEDMLALWGDGVFAILFKHADFGTTTIVAERLRRTVASLQDPFEGSSMRTTASVGLATAQLDGTALPSGLVGIAEDNLKKALDGGGDRVVPGFRDDMA